MTAAEDPHAAALAVLQAVMEAADSRVSANERLRAVEMYRELGGGESDAARALSIEIAQMSDVELSSELAVHLGALLGERDNALRARPVEPMDRFDLGIDEK
jgi:uncharacterized tellurite resistance protein B-like protein